MDEITLIDRDRKGVLGLDLKAARVTWTVFLIALLVFLVYTVREAIALFIIAIFLAYMLFPLVRFVERVTPPRFSHTASLAAVYVALVVVLILLGVWFGTHIVDEAQNFGTQLPNLIQRSTNVEAIPVPAWLEPYKARLAEFIRERSSEGASRLIPLLQRAIGGMAGIAGSLGFSILVPIIAFLFLKDAAEIRKYLLGWVPIRHRKVAADIMDDVHKLLAEYIRALVILSALTAVSYTTFFEAIGMQFALLLGVTAALLEFIPFVGPLSGAVLVLLVAVFTSFHHIWWLLIFFTAYRAVQDYVVQPHLLASGTQLHPLVVFFGAFAGEAIAGVWGMFLSVPTLAALRIVLVRVAKRRSAMAPDPEQQHQVV